MWRRGTYLRDSSPAAALSESRVNCTDSSSTSTVAETVMQPFTRKPAFSSSICSTHPLLRATWEELKNNAQLILYIYWAPGGLTALEEGTLQGCI